MSLVHRKPRPIKRDDPARLRDDRLFVIGCDDTYAPKQYFAFFSLPRIHVHVVETKNGENAAEHVLDRLLDEKRKIEPMEEDEFWLLLDCDHYTQGAHLRSFMNALARARQQGVNVALSKPSFELWLLLHHQEETALHTLTNAANVESALRTQLGQYNKTKLKKEHFPLELVPNACQRAGRLDQNAPGEIPGGNTSRVYLLWRAITAKALPSQLPVELQSLLDHQ